MTVIDIHASIITEVYNLIKASQEMQAIFSKPSGDEWIFNGFADEDPHLPYITLWVNDIVQQDQWGMAEAGLTLDLWDYSPNLGNLLVARGVLITLLDRRTITNESIGAARMFFDRSDHIPEPESRVKHYVVNFTVRYSRDVETNIINQRSI